MCAYFYYLAYLLFALQSCQRMEELDGEMDVQ